MERSRLPTSALTHELRFRSLFDAGRGYTFPCDAQGHIRLEALSESARASYQRVQARVGCELAAPVVIDLLLDDIRPAPSR